MPRDTNVHDALAAMLAYPSAERLPEIRRAADVVAAALPDLLGSLAPLRALIDEGRAAELEERYCEAFDNSAERALEVGWHSFGESYSRGSFLVFMRDRLRALGIEENGELPDHLGSVLRVAARLDADDADFVVREVAAPGVRKMLEGFKPAQANPWRGAVTAALALLTADAGVAEVFHV
jgi:nitrate reductase molybdenum cofactor assembly chaperone NarJ/NarW